MSKTPFPSRRIWITCAVSFVVLGLGVAIGLSQNLSNNKPGKPSVIWTPTSTNMAVAAGESKTFTVSFVPSGDLNNVALRVVPQIQPFIQVVPSSLNNVRAGSRVTLNLTVTAPATTLPQTASGTIQLRLTDGNHGDIPNPLPVAINIIWAQFSDPQTGALISYPDFGVPSQVNVISNQPDATRLDIALQSTNSTNFVSTFSIFLTQNTNHLSLSDWFHQNIDPDGSLIANGSFTETQLANGATALTMSGPLPDNFGPVMSLYGISPSGKTIISLAQSQDNQLQDYGLTQDQIRQIIIQILTNLQVP